MARGAIAVGTDAEVLCFAAAEQGLGKSGAAICIKETGVMMRPLNCQPWIEDQVLANLMVYRAHGGMGAADSKLYYNVQTLAPATNP